VLGDDLRVALPDRHVVADVVAHQPRQEREGLPLVLVALGQQPVLRRPPAVEADDDAEGAAETREHHEVADERHGVGSLDDRPEVAPGPQEEHGREAAVAPDEHREPLLGAEFAALDVDAQREDDPAEQDVDDELVQRPVGRLALGGEFGDPEGDPADHVDQSQQRHERRRVDQAPPPPLHGSNVTYQLVTIYSATSLLRTAVPTSPPAVSLPVP
jgi:hypothetical protein